MLDRYGIEGRDRRNLLIVMGTMTVVLAVLSEGTVSTRLVAGLIGACFSGVVFLLVTIVIKRHSSYQLGT